MGGNDESGHIRQLEDALRLFGGIAHSEVEMAVFAYLNRGHRILGVRHMHGGWPDRLELRLRDVVRDALSFDAAGMVMAHNHPSGDPTPSRADREATGWVVRAMAPIGIRLLDHLVVARGGTTSFRERGWL